jgi:spore coat protein SA
MFSFHLGYNTRNKLSISSELAEFFKADIYHSRVNNLKSGKIHIAVISGTMEKSLHPVPPVADSAPEWNIFRLAEASVKQRDCRIIFHVISPCEERQLGALQKFSVLGRYSHVIIKNNHLWLYRNILRHILPLRIAVRRLVFLPDILSWWYLYSVKQWLKNILPDLVMINARPQYIRYLRRIVPKGRLMLFMRGPLGESRRFLAQLDGIIVNSDGMFNYARQYTPRDFPPIWKIPNSLGDDFKISSPPTNRFYQKNKIILFVGRLIPEKGSLYLLEAFRKVNAEMPEARLVICGSSDNYQTKEAVTAYEKEIHEKARQLPPSCVRFEGYVQNINISKYYTSSCLAVFPSVPTIYVESFGMVALEAMRCRTPIVATCQPGFKELIEHGKTGLFIDDPADSQTLANAIMKILSNPSLAKRMGEAGYRKSLLFTPEKALHAFEKIVTELTPPLHDR